MTDKFEWYMRPAEHMAHVLQQFGEPNSDFSVALHNCLGVFVRDITNCNYKQDGSVQNALYACIMTTETILQNLRHTRRHRGTLATTSSAEQSELQLVMGTVGHFLVQLYSNTRSCITVAAVEKDFREQQHAGARPVITDDSKPVADGYMAVDIGISKVHEQTVRIAWPITKELTQVCQLPCNQYELGTQLPIASSAPSTSTTTHGPFFTVGLVFEPLTGAMRTSFGQGFLKVQPDKERARATLHVSWPDLSTSFADTKTHFGVHQYLYRGPEEYKLHIFVSAKQPSKAHKQHSSTLSPNICTVCLTTSKSQHRQKMRGPPEARVCHCCCMRINKQKRKEKKEMEREMKRQRNSQ